MQRILLNQKSTKQAIEIAAKALTRGELVIYPTETTYGMAIDPTNPEAVARLLRYKGRRDGKPISIAVLDQGMAEQYVVLNDQAKIIYERYLPGPVTVISTGKHIVCQQIETPDGSLGIRIPNHPIALSLIEVFKKPITATGANASFQKRPYSIDDVLAPLNEDQKNLISVALDAGALPPRPPSTVIDTRLDDFQVLRKGSISFQTSKTIESTLPEETIQAGEQCIRMYKSYLSHTPIIILLNGEMGAGKTQFAKGIARGLGVEHIVSSPTYQLAKEYRFTGEGEMLRFVHMDAWKMRSSEELRMLGLEEMIAHHAVIAVEWADRVLEAFNGIDDEAIIIQVSIEQDETYSNRRLITIGEKLGDKQ